MECQVKGKRGFVQKINPALEMEMEMEMKMEMKMSEKG